jgi:hypothetical protein
LERRRRIGCQKRSSFKKWKGRNEEEDQERMESRSRKRSSSAGSEKMERDGDRWDKMEEHCSTGQSPQRAVAPMEREEDCHSYFGRGKPEVRRNLSQKRSTLYYKSYDRESQRNI